MATIQTPRPLPIPEKQSPAQVYLEDSPDTEKQRLPIGSQPKYTPDASPINRAYPTPASGGVRPDHVSPVRPMVKRDKDDDEPTPVPSPAATSDAPKPPKPGDAKATSTSSLPTNSPTNFSNSVPTTIAADTSGGGGLNTEASIGIGVGATSIVILFLVLGFFFLRRRKTSRLFSAAKGAYDEEDASKTERPEVWAHMAPPPGVVEMVGEKHVPELPSPVVPVEAIGDHSQPTELPGCAVPSSSGKKDGDERLFGDSPIEPDNRSEIEASLINRKEVGS